MTIKARVELIGSFTHNSHWRKFRKGSPQILTNPAEIQYYQNQYGFDVVLLDPEIKEKVVIQKTKSKSKTKVNNDVVKPEENEIEEEHYEDEECEEREEDEEDDEEYEEEDEEEEEDTGYTEGMLKDFKKSQLKSLANDLELDIEGTKKELMARIIDATNQS
jgi:hypothetical protein